MFRNSVAWYSQFMRRDGRAAPGTQAARRPNAYNDGSGGAFVRGLPRDVAGFGTSKRLDYDARAGCPRSTSGGDFEHNVDGFQSPGESVNRRPFKLGRR
jgi:hypothetical protein